MPKLTACGSAIGAYLDQFSFCRVMGCLLFSGHWIALGSGRLVCSSKKSLVFSLNYVHTVKLERRNRAIPGGLYIVTHGCDFLSRFFRVYRIVLIIARM